MTTPRRQFPSLMTFGVSQTAATVSPLTSVPSTSPLFTSKTRTTLQRSFVAPRDSEAVQGQTTSHEQLSKYEPVRFQVIAPSSRRNRDWSDPTSGDGGGQPRAPKARGSEGLGTRAIASPR